MYRHLIPLLLLLGLGSGLRAAPIDAEAALERLCAAMRTRWGRAASGNVWQLAECAAGAYLFRTDDGHFALAAKDDRLPAVLGYGMTGDDAPPPALRTLMMRTPAPQYTASSRTAIEPVAPLLTFVRHQNAPYNRYCPRIRQSDGTLSDERAVVGCVATALEEVISYHRRRVTLCDTLYGWTTPQYTIDDIPPGESVDTRLVRDNYDSPADYTEAEAEAVARLSYWCGVAARMNWGLASSGAHISTLEAPLRRAFGFGYVHHVDSYKYRPDDWIAMLRAEVQARRPVLISGFSMHLHGHAFVLDGLDGDGLFHVNWGVDGDYDGYFHPDLLNAAETPDDLTEAGAWQGYFCNQEALLLHPDPQPDLRPDTLARTGYEVTVDSVRFGLPPMAGKCSPVDLYLHNTSDRPLTTPFELFTNAPGDTALFEQGDYIALTGVRLAPDERRRVRVMPQFHQPGRRTLRLSPDDAAILCDIDIDVLPPRAEQLTFATPELAFPAPGTVEVRQTITNAAAAGRAGWKVTYELFEGRPRPDHNGRAHVDYCLLPPGGEETDSVRFHGLRTDTDYTLLVRYPWDVRHEVVFRLPDAAAIAPPAEPNRNAMWYDLSGRHIAAPERRGVYLRRDGVTVRKIIIENKP